MSRSTSSFFNRRELECVFAEKQQLEPHLGR
jgi:hypothetical protein